MVRRGSVRNRYGPPVGDWDAIRALDGAEGQAAAVQAGALSLGPALRRLGAQIAAVPLGERAEHRQEEEALRRGVIEVGLGHRADADADPPKMLEQLEGRPE